MINQEEVYGIWVGMLRNSQLVRISYKFAKKVLVW